MTQPIRFTWQRSRPEGWCSGYDPKSKECKRGAKCLCLLKPAKKD